MSGARDLESIFLGVAGLLVVFGVFDVLGVDGVLSEASDGFYPLYYCQ